MITIDEAKTSLTVAVPGTKPTVTASTDGSNGYDFNSPRSQSLDSPHEL